MKVTYLAHSGFLAELDTAYLLFDYFEGKIPTLNQQKKLFVFASHRHKDHMNPEIFRLKEQYPRTEYILSYDIRLNDFRFRKWNIRKEWKPDIHSVLAAQTYEFAYAGSSPDTENILKVSTLKSTDAGVAFLAECGGKTLYHAGDLNWWVWPGDSKQDYQNMTARFQREADSLTGKRIDIAFLPLDSRQEEYFSLGFDYILQKVRPDIVFPMHMWEDYKVIGRYENKTGSKIMHISHRGQEFLLD